LHDNFTFFLNKIALLA